MRLTKALSATVVVVGAALALAWAGTASAETLCKVAPETGVCPAGKAYGIPTTLKGHTGGAKFVAGAITVECESDIKGETTENQVAGKGLKGALTELTFANCKGCESATAEGLSYKFLFLASGLGNGAITLNEGAGGGIPRIKFVNCSGVNCIYGAAAITLRFKGSANEVQPAHIEIEEAQTLQKQMGSNVLCAATADWEKANYELSTPLPVWLAASP